MNKISSKIARKAHKRAKERLGRKWARVMFSIDSEVYKAFKRLCERESLKHSVVVEEFMKIYIQTANERTNNR